MILTHKGQPALLILAGLSAFDRLQGWSKANLKPLNVSQLKNCPEGALFLVN